MNGRGESTGARGASGRVVLALALLVIAAAGVAACGGSSSSDIGPYLGVWQRVEAGAPNPDFTLTVARQGDGAAVTFANLTNGQSRTVAATAEDGYLACTLPNGDDPQAQPAGPSPSSGVALASRTCSSASTRTASWSWTSSWPTARPSRSGSTTARRRPRRPNPERRSAVSVRLGLDGLRRGAATPRASSLSG